jgi:flagellar assembly protein FliH
LSPNAAPFGTSSSFGRRIVAAEESGTFARAPIASRLLPPPIPVGPTEEEDLASQLDAARAEGYEAGRSDALTDPERETERERVAALAHLVSTITAIADRVAADRQQLLEEMTNDVADLAFAVVEAALGANLAGPEAVHSALRGALELAPENEALVVRLHPDAAVDPDCLTELVDARNLLVVNDSAIDPNGCVVEVGPSRIDAQIPAAIERVRRVFGALRHDKNGTGRP